MSVPSRAVTMTEQSWPLLEPGADPRWRAGRGWRLSPHFLLRVAGLPVRTLDRLHACATAGWAARALAAEDALRRGKDATVDALERAIARHLENKAIRRHLIGLRRDVFNLRPPAGREALRELLPRLAASDAASVGASLAAWQRYETLLAAGDEIVATDLVRTRTALGELADEPALRAGILLASPLVDAALTDHPVGTAVDKRARRAERSLLEYAQRTVVKTSPFSTLTTIGLGRFVASGDRLVDADIETTEYSVAQLNIAALGGLSALIVANDDLRPGLAVRLTTGWRVDGDRVRYVRRRHVRGDGTDVAVAVGQLHEELFALPSGPLLTEVLAVLAAAGQLPLGELAHRLANANPLRDPVDVRHYLDHLLRLGLLVAPPLVPDLHHGDPVARYADGLRDCPLPGAKLVAQRLGQVGSAIARYGAAPLVERRQLLAEIRTELATAHADLGAPEVPPPRTLVYEDVTVGSVRILASVPQWSQRLLPTLCDLAEALPVFDSNLPRRLVTKGFFRSRYGAGGRCDDFQAFAHEFHQDFFHHYSTQLSRAPRFDRDGRLNRRDNWFGLPEVTALDNARATVAQRVSAGYRELPPGAEELVLPEGFFAEVAAARPDTHDEAASWSMFAQLTADGSQLVLNRVYAGLTLMFSRFARCLGGDGLITELRCTLAAAQPPGVVFAEMRGGHDATNLNLHPVLTAYELVCPGELSSRPADEQILVDDLYVVDDPAADRLRLRSRRLDLDVVPVYLGYLFTPVLPELQQVLLNFSPLGLARLDLWSGVPVRPATRRPRVRCGDVVLARRTWTIPAADMPEVGARTAPGALAWARWRRDHELPRRVFAAPELAEGATAWVERKPLYVDLESPLSVDLLNDLTRSVDRAARSASPSSQVVLTEMLPGPDQLWLRRAGAPHVSELVIELTRDRALS